MCVPPKAVGSPRPTVPVRYGIQHVHTWVRYNHKINQAAAHQVPNAIYKNSGKGDAHL